MKNKKLLIIVLALIGLLVAVWGVRQMVITRGEASGWWPRHYWPVQPYPPKTLR